MNEFVTTFVSVIDGFAVAVALMVGVAAMVALIRDQSTRSPVILASNRGLNNSYRNGGRRQ